MRRLTLPALAATLLLSPAVRAEKIVVETLQSGLEHPWSLAFLPDGQGLLLTERAGRLRRWQPGVGLSSPILGVPAVWAQRQGGLLDVVLAPDFARSRRVWLSYTLAGENGAAGAVVGYGHLSDDYRQLDDFQPVLRQQGLSAGANLGTRMAFDRSGHLFIAFGDNFQSASAQDLTVLQGKIVRLTAGGEIPADNPFVGRADARAEIWSWGVRNPQGLALNPVTGDIWESEHGPRGGDEVNIVRRGKNYGWPLATWGIDYNGENVPGSKGGRVAGTEQPLFYWKVSPAISGMAFYQATRFPQWKNSLFIGALKEKSLIRLRLNGERLVEQERLLVDRGERIRDVRSGPDGWLYVLTDEASGKLLKVGVAP